MKNNFRLLILFSILLNITACKKNSSNGQVEDNTSSEKSNAETIVSDNKSAAKKPEEVKAVELVLVKTFVPEVMCTKS